MPIPPSPFPSGKDDCRSRDPDRGRFPRHPWTTFSTSWRRASDRGDPARNIGNDIGERVRGGGESLKGMRYPTLRTDITQDSAPIACQCLQCEQATPHPQRRWQPVRRTSSRQPLVCHQSSRSRQRQSKRAPYPCSPASSDTAG